MCRVITLNEYVTLKKNNEFRRLYSNGRIYRNRLVVTYVMKTKRDCARAGITTSKKIGNAVLRNRSRRIIREAYLSVLPEINTGCDIVFVARGKTPFVKSSDILRVMKKQLKEAGVLV